MKLSSLGDVVHTLPVVADIRQALPDARIDWVVERAFAPLVQRCEGVVRVIECELRRWRREPLAPHTRAAFRDFRTQLQAQAYDAVIDLQGLSKSAVVARMARLAPQGARHAMANRTDGSSWEPLTRWLAHRAHHLPAHVHAVERGRLLCALALGYPVPATPPACGLRRAGDAGAPHGLGSPGGGPEDGVDGGIGRGAERDAGGPAAAGAGVVALVHGTSRDDKLWPQPHWVDLAQRLAGAGLHTALVRGSAAEAQRAQAIAQAVNASHPGHCSVWPALGLDALADAFAGCVGVIGVDSGPSHIAVALGLPHVQIYNFDTAWRTGPLGDARQLSVFDAAGPTVDAVWAAWQQASRAGAA